MGDAGKEGREGGRGQAAQYFPGSHHGNLGQQFFQSRFRLLRSRIRCHLSARFYKKSLFYVVGRFAPIKKKNPRLRLR